MFIAVLFIIARIWKKPNINRWMDQDVDCVYVCVCIGFPGGAGGKDPTR